MTAYLLHIATLIFIYLIIVSSYSLVLGYAGLRNFGHVGLLAIGAYSSAILTTRGMSFWLALGLSALLTGAAGFILALPSNKIKGEYYLLITLGFTFMVNAVLLNGGELTGGPFGLSGIARPPGFEELFEFSLLSLVAAALVLFFVHQIVSSPYGRALGAVRDDDLVAEALGKPTAKLRLTVSFVSAILAGIGGALLAHFIRFINPQLFWLDSVVFILTAVVVGGLASFRGAIAGTVLLFFLTEVVRFLPLNPVLVGPLRLIIYSLLLLSVVIFKPKGLFGRAQLE